MFSVLRGLGKPTIMVEASEAEGMNHPDNNNNNNAGNRTAAECPLLSGFDFILCCRILGGYRGCLSLVCHQAFKRKHLSLVSIIFFTDFLSFGSFV